MDRSHLPDIMLAARDLSRLGLLTGRIACRSPAMDMLARERARRAGQSADPVCAVRDGEREARTPRTLLPELASLHGTPVEEGAATLRQADGISASLRPTEPPERQDLAAIRSRDGVSPIVR
jgi:hypothetical protein